jgi:phage terminase large subunit
MWSAQRETGRTVSEIFAGAGITLVKASNARVQGWLILKEYLSSARRQAGTARLRHLRDPDPEPARPAPQRYDPSDAAAEPHEYTHGPDAVRYLCSYRTLGARREEPGEETAREGFDDAMRGGAVSGSYLYQ